MYSGGRTEEGSESSSGAVPMEAGTPPLSALFTFLYKACTVLRWLVQPFLPTISFVSLILVRCILFLLS